MLVIGKSPIHVVDIVFADDKELGGVVLSVTATGNQPRSSAGSP
jgi:hypothetical protein